MDLFSYLNILLSLPLEHRLDHVSYMGEGELLVFYIRMAVCANTWEFLKPNEREVGGLRCS